MVRVFPSLRGVKIDYSWGGTNAISRHLLPLIGQSEAGLWYCTGFGGHGVVATTLGGLMLSLLGCSAESFFVNVKKLGEMIAESILKNDPTCGGLQQVLRLSHAGGTLGRAAVQSYLWVTRLNEELRLRFE